jgi:hypothetical protein
MKSVDISIEHLAPLIVYDEQGGKTPLADLWAARPTALVFIRHFG